MGDIILKTERTTLRLINPSDLIPIHSLHSLAGCAVDNIASIKVLEKAAMIKEGRRREILPLKTGWSDNSQSSILESDHR